MRMDTPYIIHVPTRLSNTHNHTAHQQPPQSILPVLQALTGECGFLAANLYARSIFGEDALANLSIERLPGAAEGTPVTGHIRIRAKSQVCLCVCVCVV